ncbi:unnamed protein product [Closterium sp. NIES-54]
MASRTLVSGLPRSLPPLPPGPAPTCVPCVEGRQRAAPHSSSFPPTEAPLQTLHMDVWGPARVRGQGHERYFLLVVDDYSRYTSVFPLRSKGEVPEVLIDWIRGARRRLSERFGSDLPVLRLHSDRGGEFSSDLLRAFCRAEGIRQTFTLPASPQKNGISERRIGMVMNVARTSMIHAVAPHFLWPFAVQYAAHQINLQPRVSLASLLTHPGGSSTTPPRVVFRPLRTSRLTNPAEPVEVAVDSGAARSAEPERVEPGGAESGGSESGRAEPGGAELACAESGGALGVPSRWEPLSPQQLRKWYSRCCRGAAGDGAAGAAGGAPGAAGGTVGASATGAAGGAAGAARGAAGAAGGAAGAAGAGAAGAAGGAPGAAGGTAGAGAVGAAGGAAGASATGAAGGATGAAGGAASAAGGAAGAGAAGAAGGAAGAAGGAAAVGATGAARGAVGIGDPGAVGAGFVSAVFGGAARPRPYYVQLLQQVLGSPPSPGPPPPFLSPPPVQSQSLLHPTSPLPGPSPYSGPTRGFTERREPESRPVSPESRFEMLVRNVRAGRVSHPRPPPVPGTHSMTLHPSIASQRVPLPSPPASSLPASPDPASDSLRAASPGVTGFLATACQTDMLSYI